MFMKDDFEDSPRSSRRGRHDDMEEQKESLSDKIETLDLDDRRSGRPGSHSGGRSREDEVVDLDGTDAYLSGSRSSVIEHQRDLQKKKLQERLGGGVVRSSMPRNFSAPRSTDVDDNPTRFGRDDDRDDDPFGRSSRPRRNMNEPSSSRRLEEDNDEYANRSGYSRNDRDRRDDRGSREYRKDRSRERGRRDRDHSRERTGNKVQSYSRDNRDRSASREREARIKKRQHTPPRHLGRGKEDSRKSGRGRDRYSSESRSRSRSRSRSSSASPRRSQSRSYSRSPDSPDRRDDDSSRGRRGNHKERRNLSKGKDETKARKRIDITDMRTFLTKPVPKANDIVECYIERNKSGANKVFPEYCLYLKDGDRFLLTAKKRAKNRTSNYLISMQRGDLTRHGSDNFLGKLRSNFLGTEFTIYDNGVSPKEPGATAANVREELGIALYSANVLGHRGPRKMKVCVPRVKEDNSYMAWKPMTRDGEMVQKCKEQDHTNLTYLINKPPRWNDQVCAYVLNFNGRVTMASVKNFQLVTPEDQETVVLQFGRVGKDLFTMDFRWPLCPLQAFGITLSSFDSKLACE